MQQSKKQKIELSAGMIICIAAAVIGLGFGIFGMIKAGEKPAEAPAPVEVDRNFEISDLINNLAGVEIEYFGNADLLEKTVDNRKTIAIAKVPGTDIYADYYQSYELIIGNETMAGDTKVLNAHIASEKLLIEKNFRRIEAEETKNFGSFYYNENNGISCLVTEQKAPATITCTNEKWISDEKVELIKALSESLKSNLILLGDNVVENASGSKYQRIRSFSSDLAKEYLLYRKNPDDKWKHFADAATTGALCKDFNEEAIKAYVSETCIDDFGNPIVIQTPTK